MFRYSSDSLDPDQTLKRFGSWDGREVRVVMVVEKLILGDSRSLDVRSTITRRLMSFESKYPVVGERIEVFPSFPRLEENTQKILVLLYTSRL